MHAPVGKTSTVEINQPFMKRILYICTAALLSLSASAFAEGKKYIIVLHTPSMIPAAFEKAVQDAGGTITTRLPELGAVGVQSDNPNFVAAMQANKTVENISEDA